MTSRIVLQIELDSSVTEAIEKILNFIETQDKRLTAKEAEALLKRGEKTVEELQAIKV